MYADTQALNLLYNTLASGTFASQKALIPLPQHFALAATLLVHPSTTTRAKSAEHKEAAHAALRLLRLANTLVSPRDAQLDQAFSFEHSQISRSGRRLLGEDSGNHGNLPSEGKIKWRDLDVARESSLWSRAEDFWHVVGWAFNCSVLHPDRWERWQIWLQFMCETIDDDWKQREAEYEQIQKRKKQEAKDLPSEPPDRDGSMKTMTKNDDLNIFRESMIFQYISANPPYGRNRRIIRAIFAEGSSTSVNEFRQIFNNELKPLKSDQNAGQAKKRDRNVNIDKGEYGDYLSEDESEEDINTSTGPSIPTSRSGSPPAGGTKTRRTKRTRRGTRNATDPSSTTPGSVRATTDQNTLTQHSGGVSPIGGLDSLSLRKKLLSMLSQVSEKIPQSFMPIDDLYHLFVENIRPLPLPIFQAFISPYVLHAFSPAEQTSLCELLLFCMLESSATPSNEQRLKQDILERCYLPFAASTASAVDNAKVSMLLEALIMLLANEEMLSVTPSFKEALENGILHRADRAQDEMRRSQAARDKEPLEWCWLVESGERLNYLVELLSLQGSQAT